MAVSNAQLQNALWLRGSNSYQQRVPSPTVASQAAQFKALWEYQPTRNEFIDGLVNLVGLSYVRQHSWRNPLAVFKKRKLAYGDTVLEAQAKLVAARSYSDSRETLLKVHRPEVAQCVHKVDRFDQYPISINHLELRRAASEEYGLNQYVAAIMDSCITSEAWDEYTQMIQLMSWFDDNLGFYRIHGSAPSDEATAKAFLQSVREIAGMLEFPSGKYMAQAPEIQGAGLTTWAKPSELVIFMTPATKAAIDVQALSAAFQLPYSEIEQRIVLVQEFPMPNVYAMVTTEDWFQVYDQAYENGSFYNPETLTTNYYLTVTQVMSCSPFVPAIVWTTEAGTEDGTITQTVSTNQVTPAGYIRSNFGEFTAISAGDEITREMVTGKDAAGHPSLSYDGVYLFGQLDGSLSLGDVTGVQEIDGVTVRPDAYIVTGLAFTAAAGETAPAINSRTYVDRLGRLHLQAAAFKSAGGLTLTVTLEPTYVNPSGETPTPTPTTYAFAIAGTED